MELTILICLFFTILFFVTNIKNRYHLLFTGMLLGVTLTFVVSLVLATKGSNYTFSPHYSYFASHSLRFYLYSFFVSLFRQSSWNQLVIYRNLGMSIFFICLILFVRSFYQSTFRKKDSAQKRLNVPILLMTVYPMLYFFFYHPDTAYHIYIFYHNTMHQNVSHAQAYSSFIRLISNLFTLTGVFYLFYPLYYLLSKGIKNEISFFSEQFIGLSISLGLFNFTMLNTFFFHSLKLSIDKVFTTGYWGICLSGQLPFYYSAILPFMTFIFLCMAFYFTLMFGIDSMIGGWREHVIRKNLNKMYLNLRDVFHTDKNLFFSIQKLSELAESQYGTEEGLAALHKIKEISDAQMDILTKNLNNIKKINIKNSSTDLIEILETAIMEVESTPQIKIIREYPQSSVYCFLDTYHLLHVFTNILYNSVDAIRKKGEPDGIITICLTSSNDWIFCSITDNGCGIQKKTFQKHLLAPQESTIRPNHYGMGIPYIHQVIHAHGGHIRFRSRINTFTAVDILLPQARYSDTHH